MNVKVKYVQHVVVSEDVAVHTVVHVIQAYDPDGDDVTFTFTGTHAGIVDCTATPINIAAVVGIL